MSYATGIHYTLEKLSGKLDLNQRSLAPHASMLPSCTTTRYWVGNYGPDRDYLSTIRQDARITSNGQPTNFFDTCLPDQKGLLQGKDSNLHLHPNTGGLYSGWLDLTPIKLPCKKSADKIGDYSNSWEPPHLFSSGQISCLRRESNPQPSG